MQSNSLQSIINAQLGVNKQVEYGSVYVIGDIHGCAHEFQMLIEMIIRDDPFASIYQVGDLIDRGPSFLEVFQLCDYYDVKTTIGNHELKFYHELTTGAKCRSKARRVSHSMFANYTEEEQGRIMRRIVNSPAYYEVELVSSEVHTVMISHSPLDEHLLSFPYSHPAGGCMTNAHRSDNGVNIPFNIHGHMSWDYTDIHDQLDNYFNPNTPINIDSGCVYGNGLTAIRANDLRPFQVKSVKYAEQQ